MVLSFQPHFRLCSWPGLTTCFGVSTCSCCIGSVGTGFAIAKPLSNLSFPDLKLALFQPNPALTLGSHHLGSAIVGTATIFEMYTTTGASGAVLHAASAASVRCKSATRPSGASAAPRRCACRGGSRRGSRSGAAACRKKPNV